MCTTDGFRTAYGLAGRGLYHLGGQPGCVSRTNLFFASSFRSFCSAWAFCKASNCNCSAARTGPKPQCTWLPETYTIVVAPSEVSTLTILTVRQCLLPSLLAAFLLALSFASPPPLVVPSVEPRG